MRPEACALRPLPHVTAAGKHCHSSGQPHGMKCWLNPLLQFVDIQPFFGSAGIQLGRGLDHHTRARWWAAAPSRCGSPWRRRPPRRGLPPMCERWHAPSRRPPGRSSGTGSSPSGGGRSSCSPLCPAGAWRAWPGAAAGPRLPLPASSPSPSPCSTACRMPRSRTAG
jgi:hypothetical protein